MTDPGDERRLRLFVAVDVPAHVRSEVSAVAAPLRAVAGDARWTDPQGWHLTLAFLGWVQPGLVDPIASSLRGVARRAAAFTLTLDGGAGTFAQRVLWVGFDPSAELEALAVDVGRALEGLGFPREERAFHAHLTLARSPRDTRLPRGIEQRYTGRTLTWPVNDLALMRSELRARGARYSVEERFPLGQGPPEPDAINSF